MKNKLLLVVLIAFCLLQSPAQAAEYYVSGSGGVSLMQNIKIQSIYPTEDYTDTYQLGSGAALFGAVGSTFGQYRFEGERWGTSATILTLSPLAVTMKTISFIPTHRMR